MIYSHAPKASNGNSVSMSGRHYAVYTCEYTYSTICQSILTMTHLDFIMAKGFSALNPRDVSVSGLYYRMLYWMVCNGFPACFSFKPGTWCGFNVTHVYDIYGAPLPSHLVLKRGSSTGLELFRVGFVCHMFQRYLLTHKLFIILLCSTFTLILLNPDI